jgi:hypothetical protein
LFPPFSTRSIVSTRALASCAGEARRCKHGVPRLDRREP